MAIVKHRVTVNTSGSDGSATGSGLAVTGKGRLIAAYLDFHASAPATTDVTLTAEGDPDGPGDATLLTASNSATDAWKYPTAAAVDSAGASVAGLGVPPVVHGGAVGVSVAQCNALSGAVVVDLYVEA